MGVTKAPGGDELIMNDIVVLAIYRRHPYITLKVKL